MDLRNAVDSIAGRTAFSGAVRVDRGATFEFARAYGSADRAHDVPNTPDTRLGFWLHASIDVVMLEGYDAGVSLRSMHDPATTSTFTVISNTSEGAWPSVELLEGRLAD